MPLPSISVFLPDSDKRKFNGPIPQHCKALFQLADGLHYIHKKEFVHRDIKPENILISASQPVRMIWSDFGMSKPVTKSGSFSLSAIKGTFNWMAPELLELDGKELRSGDDQIRGSIKSDTFSAGCIFFYLVKEGQHPFGERSQCIANIKNGNPVNLMSKYCIR